MPVRFGSADAVTGELISLGMTEEAAQEVTEDARNGRSAFGDGVPTQFGYVLYTGERHWEITYTAVPVIPRREQPRGTYAAAPRDRDGNGQEVTLTGTAMVPGPQVTYSPGQSVDALQARMVPERDAWRALAEALRGTGSEIVTGGVAVRCVHRTRYALALT